MLDESRKKYIRYITKSEMEQILEAWRDVIYGQSEKKWGGLFICTIKREGHHPFRKFRYIAIDDSEGTARTEEFKTKEAAIN